MWQLKIRENGNTFMIILEFHLFHNTELWDILLHVICLMAIAMLNGQHKQNNECIWK